MSLALDGGHREPQAVVLQSVAGSVGAATWHPTAGLCVVALGAALVGITVDA